MLQIPPQWNRPLCHFSLSRYFFLIWEFLVYIPDKCRHQSRPGGCLPRHLGKWYYYLTGCAILLMQASFLILRNNSLVLLAFSLHSITCTTFLVLFTFFFASCVSGPATVFRAGVMGAELPPAVLLVPGPGVCWASPSHHCPVLLTPGEAQSQLSGAAAHLPLGRPVQVGHPC